MLWLWVWVGRSYPHLSLSSTGFFFLLLFPWKSIAGWVGAEEAGEQHFFVLGSSSAKQGVYPDTTSTTTVRHQNLSLSLPPSRRCHRHSHAELGSNLTLIVNARSFLYTHQTPVNDTQKNDIMAADHQNGEPVQILENQEVGFTFTFLFFSFVNVTFFSSSGPLFI